MNSAQRKRVYVGLYQTHFPKIDDAGVIDYNQDRGLITLSENATLLDEYLEYGQERPDRWWQWYVLVSGSGMMWMTSAYLSVPVLSIGPMHLVSGLVVGALALISLVHFLTSYQTQRTIEDSMSNAT